MWAGVLGLTGAILLWLNLFPGQLLGDTYFQGSIAAYFGVALFAYGLVLVVGSPSLQYFGLPHLTIKTLFVVICLVPSLIKFTTGDNLESKDVLYSFAGIIFLILISLGEEIFCRGFLFGIFKRFGMWKAIWLSSLIFGLLHLNLYRGENWDPWRAYAHVWSAFSFGVLACAVMITTGSIWLSVVMHTVLNWRIVFGKEPASDGPYPDWYFDSLWQGFSYPLLDSALTISLAWIFLRLHRGSVPAWAYRLAIKWRLIREIPESNVVPLNS